jgi:NCAIR mutase (PurE)-related protein
MKEHQLDWQRAERTGFGETIYCREKTVAQIESIIMDAQSRGAAFLFTRLAAEKLADLSDGARSFLDYEPLSETAFLQKHPLHLPGCVALVSAGTSDMNVVGEAARTLAFHEVKHQIFPDLGVAGLWRIQSRIAEVSACQVVIVVAGMEGALPTVVAGLVAVPVIAVPTSVGYGVATGGNTALNAMLASCASGMSVMNIDNGYGAACAALRILKLLKDYSNSEIAAETD